MSLCTIVTYQAHQGQLGSDGNSLCLCCAKPYSEHLSLEEAKQAFYEDLKTISYAVQKVEESHPESPMYRDDIEVFLEKWGPK